MGDDDLASLAARAAAAEARLTALESAGGGAPPPSAAALPDVRYEPPSLPIDETLVWHTPSTKPLRNLVMWCSCSSDGVFRKIVRSGARSGAAFASMHAAYARLAALLPTTVTAAAALPAFARLLYGAHEVLVELPAVEGAREATEDEMAGGGGGLVLRQVAAAVAWLAAHRLVYVDLRAPNVLVHSGGGGGGGGAVLATLVDYDDCLLTPEPVNSLDAYRAVLREAESAGVAGDVEGCTFAASFNAGGQRAVEEALAAAFNGRGGDESC
jgi:hypothetical protein